MPEKNEIFHVEWDKDDFTMPKEFELDENSSLGDALRVFHAAEGYDFFNVVHAEQYALKWLMFVSGLYSDIVDGKYKADGEHFAIPLSEEKKNALIEQGVPEIFTKDL